MTTDPRPHLVLTVLLDAGARPAAVTMSHASAFERIAVASAGQAVLGPDLVELPVAPQAFAALRTHLGLGDDVVGLYDVFPLASHLDETLRRVAGQFLAAEAIWTLEEQGQLGGVPVNVKLDLPKEWDKDPKAVHAKLVAAGALELGEEAVEAFKAVKTAWDAAAS